MYALVGQHQFSGRSHEHPMDHIEKVEDLVSSITHAGVSNDYLFCKLFPYSLAGEAASWLKQLPPGSLTTWEATKNAFLNHFYDDARSEDLRRQISSFSQGPKESFKSAWIRFQAYQRDCPHHGFSDAQLLSTFFRGVDWRYQMSLDSASNGNFMTRSPQDAFILIKNLASSNSTKVSDGERQSQAASLEVEQLAEVQATLKSVHNLLLSGNKKSVHFADVNAAEEEENKECNFVGGNFQGSKFAYGQNKNFSSNQPFQNQNQGGYTRTYGNSDYQSPPAKSSEFLKVESMFERLLEGQQKLTVDFNGKIDAMYTDLNGKFEALNTHVKKLDIQVAQTAESVRRQEGFLPGKTELNPKQFVNSITSSGEVQQVSRGQTGREMVNFGEEQQKFSDLADLQDGVDRHHHQCRSTPSSVDLHDGQVSSADQPANESDGVSIDTTPGVDRHPACNLSATNSKNAESDPKSPVLAKPVPTSTMDTSQAPERVYKPKIPYPKPPRKSEKDIERELEGKRQAILRDVIGECPSYRFIKNSPALKGYIKQLSTTSATIEDGVQAVLKEIKAINVNLMHITKEAKADLPPSTLKKLDKLESPGRFVFDCSINGMEMKHSLCDTGATCNVMSQAVAQRLGISCSQIPKTSIILADSSPTIAKGFASDVMLRVEDCLVPADFYIMDMNEDIHRPLILGSSFLATVGALLDFPNKRVSFSKISLKTFYPFHPMKGTVCKSVLHDKAPKSVPKAAAKEVHQILKDTPSIIRPAKAKSKRIPKSYATVSIIIPVDLRNKDDDTIKEKLQGTMALFPDISAWQVKGGVLAPRSKFQRFTYDPP